MGSRPSLHAAALLTGRLARLRSVMAACGVDVVLTADPIDIQYACGARNMTGFGLQGPSRFVLVPLVGPVVLWEFAGCGHLADGLPTVDEVRDAPGIGAPSGPSAAAAITRFTAEIAQLCGRRVPARGRSVLAVERLDFPVTDALRAAGLVLADAGPVFQESRRIKSDAELDAMRAAVGRVDDAVVALESAIEVGRAEVEIWSEFHRVLIAGEGEYVSTRLFQTGANTFPYFREAGDRRVEAGDLVCLDTDAIGFGGYAVDFSRTFLCGDAEPSARQRELYAVAVEQLATNAALLGPGVSYEAFARRAWALPGSHAPYGYYCLAHGLGMSGEAPNVPLAVPGEPYPLPGEFEPGMVVCVESYVGDAPSEQGVKLEDQFLITESGAEPMTSYPFDERLCGADSLGSSYGRVRRREPTERPWR